MSARDNHFARLTYFSCDDDSTLIPSSCDGDNTISNQMKQTSYTESDACDTKHEFACQNGACVSRDFECDGHDDCGDNSDEILPCGELKT